MIKGDGSGRKDMQVCTCFYMFLALLSEIGLCKNHISANHCYNRERNNRKTSLYVSQNGLVNLAV